MRVIRDQLQLRKNGYEYVRHGRKEEPNRKQEIEKKKHLQYVQENESFWKITPVPLRYFCPSGDMRGDWPEKIWNTKNKNMCRGKNITKADDIGFSCRLPANRRLKSEQKCRAVRWRCLAGCLLVMSDAAAIMLGYALSETARWLSTTPRLAALQYLCQDS